MRRITAILMALCLVFSLFTVTTSAAAKKSKYVKVKTATYKAYKKAYDENKKLKSQIKANQNTISNLKEELDSTNSMNRWVWSNIKSIGISYNGKNWTIPNEVPEKFIIDGVTYTVTKEG